MLLKTFGPGKASPDVEKVYNSFLENVGAIPPPFLIYSASPAIQSIQAQLITYFREGSGLSPLLTALIRYLTAVMLDLEPCIEFNTRVLTAHGLTEEQIEGVRVNPATAPIGEKDGWMLAYVIKSVQSPESDLEGHVNKLREMGWTDIDVFDALYIACMMVGMERMMKALKFKGSRDEVKQRRSD